VEYRAYLMRLKKEKINDYTQIHKKDKIWKSVVESLIKSGIDKMIIFQQGRDIILFEQAQDLNKSYQYLNNDPESVRWDKMISQWMDQYPQFNEIKKDIEFKEVPVVFYFDNGRLLH